MNIYKLDNINELVSHGTAVTVGMFDGVHIGHRHILSMLSRMASESGVSPVVVTFDRHPRQVLTNDVSTRFRITTNEERYALLEQCGVAYVVEVHFTPQLASMSACEFFSQILVQQLHVKALVLGYDNVFGSRSHNDFDQLPDLAAQMGVKVFVDTAVSLNDIDVSSTQVRNALHRGDVATASAMLGRFYRLWGSVERGRQVGRKIGFPTANVSLNDPTKVLPAEGVYAVRVTLSDGTSGLMGMANIGGQPTFGLEKPVFEVNIFDFDSDIYDTTLTVDFVSRLRSIVRFDSVDALIGQLKTDRDAARQLLSQYSNQ